MRIVTRPDFDGLVCAVLLYDVEDIDMPVYWIQPNDVQKGIAKIQKGDILANVPYDRRCSMWFDHHYTNRLDQPFKGAFKIAPSAAKVIFEYYQDRFKGDFVDLVAAADKIDSADLSMDEVLHPENYPFVLLSMTIVDHGRSDEAYWVKLTDLLSRKSVDSVLRDPEVQGRCRKVIAQNKEYKALVEQYTVVKGHVSITDFRPLATAPEGNRFIVYSMYPEAAVSMKIRCAQSDRDKIRLGVGHSIFNPNCRVNVGLMLSAFEGGGHRAAGGCSFHADKADDYIPRMIEILQKNTSNEP